MEDNEFQSAASSVLTSDTSHADINIIEPDNSNPADEESEDKFGFVQTNPLTDMEEGLETSTYDDLIDQPTVEQVLMTPTEKRDVKVTQETEWVKVREPETVSQVKSSESAVAPVHVQYAVRYVGSARLPEGDLTGERSSAAMTECITTLTKGSRKSNKVIYEFKENQKVTLKFEDRELKLVTEEKNSNLILCHPLSKIRAWAVGKETDSHHFAYVIRSPDEIAGYSYLCRVFKCGIKAREVATALGNICRLRAAAKAARKY